MGPENPKGDAMKRILVVLAVTAVAALATMTAAQASVVTNTTVSYRYSGWVPCANGGAGELVNGVIDSHILETSTTNDNVDAWKFQFAPRGSLVGSVTGDTYRLGGVEHGTYVETQSGRYTLTYVNRYHLIGPGSGNNLIVRETAHLTLDGDDAVVERDEFDIECS
jgi:hypothetical protein